MPSNQPVTASSAAPRGEEIVWPFSHATQYVPSENGQVQPVLKIPFNASILGGSGEPQTFVDKMGGRRHALISPDRTRLTVFQASGQLDLCFTSPDSVHQVEYQAESDTYYVRSATTIHALKDGREIATISPMQVGGMGAMTLLGNGDLTVGRVLDGYPYRSSVVTLTPDLTPRWNREVDMQLDGLLDVGNGHVAVYDDGEAIVVLDATGNEVFRSQDPSLQSPIVHDGRLMFLESKPGKYAKKYKEVVSFDSGTGKVRRSRIGAEAEQIIPLPGGRFMVEDGEFGQPHFSVYDADGDKLKSFKFSSRYPRQLHVAQDGKTALLVAGDVGNELYQLDLEPQDSAWNLLGIRPDEKPKPVFQHGGSFRPALLTNGQVAIFHHEGIEYGGRRLSSTRELLDAVGPGVELATNQVEMSSTRFNGRVRLAGPLGQLLSEVQRDYKLPSSLVTRPDNKPYLTPDSCMNFPLPCLGAMPVAQTLTVADTGRVLRSLFKEEPTALREFENWKLELTADQLNLTDPAGQKRSRPGAFSAALPLALGEERFVAAVSEGNLLWLKPSQLNFVEETYSLGEPVTGLELGPDGRSVLASTASGARLEFTPPNFGTAVKDATEPPPPPEGKAGVHETASTVQVGGVIIRKRG